MFAINFYPECFMFLFSYTEVISFSMMYCVLNVKPNSTCISKGGLRYKVVSNNFCIYYLA